MGRAALVVTMQSGSVLQQLRRLFDRGTLAGLAEGQLLERFVTRRDEAAFEALVARFGPMVLGVCRRTLDDPNDIDDAFQATFLILVKKARSIRDGALLGNWLYGVAYRVARRARAQADRRRRREASGAGEVAVDQPHDADRDELRAVLDEELHRLPEKYRAPLVLCYLQGRTHDEAAARLNWPVGTVRSRMAKARELLRSRLMRRGLALPASALALALEAEASSVAAVSPALLACTVAAATSVVAGQAIAAGTVPAGALALSEGVMMTMKLNKLIGVTGLAVALAGGGVGVAAWQGGGLAGTRQQAPSSGRLAEPPGDAVAQAGRREAELIDRIRRLERELAAAREQVGQPAAGDQRNAIAKAILGGVGRPVGRPGMGIGGMGSLAMPGMGGTPGVGGAGSDYLVGEVMFASAGLRDGQLTAYSVETGTWESFRVPEGVASATPVMARDVLAYMLEGPKVSRVVAFDARSGAWYPQDLREPTEKAVPVVGENIVAYGVGRFVYAFSPESRKWGVLELEGAAQPQPQLGVNRRWATVEHGGRLHVFSARTGTWSSVEGNPSR